LYHLFLYTFPLYERTQKEDIETTSYKTPEKKD